MFQEGRNFMDDADEREKAVREDLEKYGDVADKLSGITSQFRAGTLTRQEYYELTANAVAEQWLQLHKGENA
jgi:hypothetical protein